MTPQEVFNALPIVRDARLSLSTEMPCSVVVPFATYSPWLGDAGFMEAFSVIQPNSLVDLYRCYELWRLVEHATRLGGDIVEVGVWRGGTGCLIAARAQALQRPVKVFLCDTFKGVVKAGDHDPGYKGGEHADTSADLVRQLAARLTLSNVTILEGVFPDDTGHMVADRRFALCHIDVDVYESAREVVEWVWPRLAVGGVVVYDDYGFAGCDGITRLVNERADQAGTITIHNLNGHAVVVKLA
ncbi:MAG: TylF/MycF/NovP-related O-methyltransferase [Pseudomonadota bacterium]